MSTTVEVAFAPQISLTTLLSDEDFEVFGIDTEAISDDDYGIAINDQSGHFFVIHGTSYQLEKFAASLMTAVRTIAYVDGEVIP